MLFSMILMIVMMGMTMMTMGRSVGVIAYVLLSGVSPFLGEDKTETYVNVTRGKWEFDEEAFADVSQPARDFVASLIVYRKEYGRQGRVSLSY